MSRLSIVCVLAPVAALSAMTNWAAPQSVTYRDLIEARRSGKPPPSLSVSQPVRRIVGRKDGKVLVETRYPSGGVTTNARTLHVIYNARTVATNAVAGAAYDAALARYALALALDAGSAADASNRDAAALHRQAARINSQAAVIEARQKPGNGTGGKAALIAALAAAVGGATALGVKHINNKRIA